MKPVLSLLSVVALLSGSLAAQSPDLAILIGGQKVEFHVSGPSETFFGAVILSLSPNVEPYVPGLPLLTDFVLLGVGIGDAEHKCILSLPEQNAPVGIFVYAQGVVLYSQGIKSTPVRDFVLDVTVPRN